MSTAGNTVIRVSDLDKTYTKRSGISGLTSTFHALQNVSFEVEKGEILGIIGNNGSGKSTLLRVLSGITKPTEGKVEIFGIPSSILDVGTGIHPELTGRENTYLRGQLLGMSRKEVAAIFEELVHFSGVEEFIDSPMQHYSSGMFLRLAFSIIVHLRSEILLLDEVMAVGDADFRRKCAAKVGEIVANGSTVVMVSHDLGTVLDMCSRSILLSKGKITADGSPKDVVRNSYLSSLTLPQHLSPSSGAESALVKSDELGFEVEEFVLKHADGRHDKQYSSDEEISIVLRYKVYKDNINLAIGIKDLMDSKLIDDSPALKLKQEGGLQQGSYSVSWTVPSGLFNAGIYFIDLFAVDDELKMIKKYDRLIQIKITDNSMPEEIQGFYRSAFKVNLNMQVSHSTF